MNRYLPSFIEQRAADFAALHAARAVAGGGAAEHLKAIGRGDLVPVLRAASSPGMLEGGSWGSELAAYRELMVAFLESLRNVGLYDAVAMTAARLPMRTKVASAATGATASHVVEGGTIPATELSLTGGDLTPRKIGGIIAVSQEVLAASGAEAFLLAELQRAVGAGTDSDFLGELDAIEILGASEDETDVLATLRNAVASLRLHAGSRLFLGLSPKACAAWSLLGSVWPAFADLSPQGGSIQGITAIPCDVVADDEAVLVDAAGFICSADDSIDVAVSRSALLDLQNSFPSETETLISLFQTESAGLRVIRSYGFVQTREASAVRISDLVLPITQETT